MNKLLLATALGFLCTGTSALFADAGQFYLAPGLQSMNYDDETGYDSDTGYVIGLGYDFTSRLSGELSVADVNPETRNKRAIDQDLWKVDLFYGLDFDLGRFTPFLVSGFGSSNIDGDNDSVWDIGAGLRLPLSDRWTWRTSVRNYYFLGRDAEDQDLGFDTSLVYRFGGANKPQRKPSVEPMPPTMATEKPVDSDKDGVADALDQCPDTPLSYAVDSAGCPVPIEEMARVELLVNFDFDQADVKAVYLGEIEEVARFMSQYPDVVVELEGHTDSRGTQTYNLDLSQRRADAVMAEFVGRFNIASSRVSARGFGESQAVASNDTASGRASNRRAITVIIKTLQRYQPR